MGIDRKSSIVIGCMTLLTALILLACSKGSDGSGGGNPGSNDAFKTGMLTNYADNVIIPAYTALQNSLAGFETAANAFLDNPSTGTQTAAKTSFKNAWISYEGASPAYFGPASTLLLNNYLNTFPASATRIEAGIQSGSYNFSVPVLSDSIQGFPALDYLLFSPTALQDFTGGNVANRKKYVQDVMSRMKSLVNDVLSQWKGTYRSTFISSLKTNVGSSIGSLVNQFAFELDALKGPRIGWPFGKQSNGIVFADKTEGYFAGISASLAVANLTSLRNFYTGAAGDGIADYTVQLKRESLNNDILAQFDIALNALKAIPEPMSAAFTNSPGTVEAAYKEVQKLLTLVKTDLASATAVQITYMDNDGD